MKGSVNYVLDAVRTFRIGDECTRDVSAQQFRRDIVNFVFKEGESVTDFGVRIIKFVINFYIFGDNIIDTEVVKKLFQVVRRSLNQVAVFIEMFVDLNKATIEDVIGRLRVFEEREKLL